jgi:UDP-glucose 4-epimerase
MYDAAERKGVRVFMGFLGRFFHTDMATKYAISQGLIGDPVYAEVRLDDNICVPTAMWGQRSKEWASASSTAHFLLSHVVDMLLEAGYDVVVIDDLSTGKEGNINPLAKLYMMDIRDDRLDEVFRTEKPDMVCHQAAQINVRESVSDPRRDAEINIIGSINVLLNCVKHNVKKIVYASSGGARYGDPDNIPCDESTPIMPLAPYGISKHTVEHYLYFFSRIYGIDYNILAYGNVYGPRQDPKGEAGVISIFSEKIMKDEPCVIWGDGKQTRDFVYVGDVAKANLLAVEKTTASKDFNIGTGKETSVNELFSLLKDAFGKGDAVHDDPVPGEVRRIALDVSRAEKELGFRAEVSIEDGIRKTAEWFLKNGAVQQ